ncbi:ankyrin repeat-containing domain protein [Flagelloscypha sp. PMI_526]|nr:ankyrin repeat-containing domain protein [Flagelloscypha sp. PMI_526]
MDWLLLEANMQNLFEYFDSGGSQVFSDILPSIGLGCLRYLNASHSPSVVQEWTEKHKLNRDPSWISEEHRYFYYCSRFWGEHARGTPAGLLGGFRTLFMNSESFSLSSRIRAEFGHGWKDPAETAWTPIHIAVFFGLETLVIQLLEEEKDATPTDKLVVTADQRDDAGRSPLSWACEKGHLGIVTLLLGRDDVEINSQDDNGQSPLLWACKNGHLHIVQLLVRNDVNVSSRDNNGQSPFLWACKTGHLNVVQHLLLARDDVDVDSQDNSGRSPLSWACGGGYRDVVRLLLSTSLFFAIFFGIPRKLLLGHSGIDVNSQDNKGRPPLSLACLGGRVDVVRLLLEHKNLKVNSRDSGGLSPLTWACLWGHCDVVRLLLAHGDVEVNSPDASGLSPLSRACLAGHYDVVRLLLAHKDVEVNSRDSGGLSALIWASRWGRLDIVQLLLVRRDVDVNSRDSKGRSPLSWACENRHPDIVKSLLGMQPLIAVLWKQSSNLIARRELEVNSRDADGLSPLSCACEKGHLLIAEQLLGTIQFFYSFPV